MLLFCNSREIHKHSNYHKSSYTAFSKSSSADDNSSEHGRFSKLPSCEISAITAAVTINFETVNSRTNLDYQFLQLRHSYGLDFDLMRFS